MLNWVVNDCKAFLQLYKGLLAGNTKVLRDRYSILSKLIKNNMQNLFSLSISELCKMCADLILQDGNKDEMVGNLFSELVNED